jgi:hypothetical protein
VLEDLNVRVYEEIAVHSIITSKTMDIKNNGLTNGRVSAYLLIGSSCSASQLVTCNNI